MLRRTILICPLIIVLAHAQGQPTNEGVPVEVVATASEYVPRSITFSHPGHAYTDCLGSTDYCGRFHGLRTVVGAAAVERGASISPSPHIEPDYHAQKCIASFGIGSKYVLAIDKTAMSEDQRSTGAATVPANDSISIGTVVVRLGMSRDIALSSVGKEYTLQRAPYSAESFIDDWWIFDRARPDEIPYIGFLRFRSNKLTEASRRWMFESKDYTGAETAEVIYKLLSKFVAEGNTNCTIMTFSSLKSSGPNDLEFRKSEIRCGHRKIEIMLDWKSGDRWIDLDETLTAEQP